MFTLRKAINLSTLLVLLFATACGAFAPAATESPAERDSNKDYEAPAATEAPAIDEAPMYAPTQSFDASNQPLGAGNPSSGVPAPSSKNEPYDMFFQDYGVNPSIDTEDDNLSTFALDVDTGSYTIMRNYLSDGNLPPPDSVRGRRVCQFL